MGLSQLVILELSVQLGRKGMRFNCGVMGSWRRLIRGLEGLLLLDLSRMERYLSFVCKKGNTGIVAVCTDRCVKVLHHQSYHLDEQFNGRS